MVFLPLLPLAVEGGETGMRVRGTTQEKIRADLLEMDLGKRTGSGCCFFCAVFGEEYRRSMAHLLKLFFVEAMTVGNLDGRKP